MKACFQIFGFPFYFVGWLAPAYRDRRSQFLRDHQISPWQGLGSAEPIPTGKHKGKAYPFGTMKGETSPSHTSHSLYTPHRW